MVAQYANVWPTITPGASVSFAMQSPSRSTAWAQERANQLTLQGARTTAAPGSGGSARSGLEASGLSSTVGSHACTSSASPKPEARLGRTSVSAAASACGPASYGSGFDRDPLD